MKPLPLRGRGWGEVCLDEGRYLKKKCSAIIFFIVFSSFSFPEAGEKPLVFPSPAEMKIPGGSFAVDSNTIIVLPAGASESDEFLAELLSSDFTDIYETPVLTRRKSFTGDEKFILMGDLSNPLISKYCRDNNLTSRLQQLGPEGYILNVNSVGAVVAANTRRGALYGLESLRQLIYMSGNSLQIRQAVISDSPAYPFRGIKLYLPGRENIAFFKRFIKDFVAFYKFNTIILELNANMRLERHPELNVGAIKFARHLDFSRLDRPPGKHMEFQNSSHQDNADGQVLEKEEVADLVNYMRRFNIEVIPELPSLTHSYYLLAGHEDLAENPEQPFPDTWCPLRPEVYDIYFDVLDEYIEVIHPSTIHVGHDEWRMEKDKCELCRGKDYGELYAADLVKIHGYLAKKGIRTAIWGDHLLESVTGKEFRIWKSSAGYEYKIPGGLRPEQVIKLIPKDILVFNWFWSDAGNDRQLSDLGFEQVYGNFRPEISDWGSRREISGVLGGAPSSWAATTETNIGKDQLMAFLGTAGLLWTGKTVTTGDLTVNTEPLIRDIRRRLGGAALPSEFVTAVTLPGSYPTGTGAAIRIGKDVLSLVFVHACEKPARNDESYRMIHNHEETAGLLGWYEVIYEDGFVATVPLRYGLNILDRNWRSRINSVEKQQPGQNRYAYLASAVDVQGQGTFFSWEWVNARPGKIIREVRLRTTDAKAENRNAIILHSLSFTEKTDAKAASGTEMN